MAKLEVATSTAEPTSPRFKELEVVNLADDFDGPDGRIPRGTQGTVLQVFGRGEAYQIEFAKVFPKLRLHACRMEHAARRHLEGSER